MRSRHRQRWSSKNSRGRATNITGQQARSGSFIRVGGISQSAKLRSCMVPHFSAIGATNTFRPKTGRRLYSIMAQSAAVDTQRTDYAVSAVRKKANITVGVAPL